MSEETMHIFEAKYLNKIQFIFYKLRISTNLH